MTRSRKIFRIGFAGVAVLLALAGAYATWCYLYMQDVRMLPLATRMATVGKDAGLGVTQPVQTLVANLPDFDVLVLGEEHREDRHAAALIAVMMESERVFPWKLGLLGLEVFGRYQALIDAFLATGDEGPLLESPGQEALRGQKGDPRIIASFLRILHAVRIINSGRTPKTAMKVMAMDHAPNEELFRGWWDRANIIDRLQWVMGRDGAMAATLMPQIESLKAEGRYSLIFVGTAHVQGSGKTVVGPPLLAQSVTWLATRLGANSRVLTVNQNDPANDCDDVIEAFLKARGDKAATLIDLRTDSLGDVLTMRCAEEFPPPLPFRFEPVNYKARDHYNFYWYYPPRRA